MHRRTDLWGPDGIIIHNFENAHDWFWTHYTFSLALVFDPDRFLDERVKKYLTPNPFIFCPFNAGPRICLGQQVYNTNHSFSRSIINIRNSIFFISQFAYHEATFFLIRLFQQFTGFALDSSANLKTPADWATGDGLKATEKIYPAAHLTMFVRVSVVFFLGTNGIMTHFVVLIREAFGYEWNRWNRRRNEPLMVDLNYCIHSLSFTPTSLTVKMVHEEQNL